MVFSVHDAHLSCDERPHRPLCLDLIVQGLAFMKDPDGYLIEILPQGDLVTKPVDHAGVGVEGGGYVDNSKK